MFQNKGSLILLDPYFACYYDLNSKIKKHQGKGWKNRLKAYFPRVLVFTLSNKFHVKYNLRLLLYRYVSIFLERILFDAFREIKIDFAPVAKQQKRSIIFEVSESLANMEYNMNFFSSRHYLMRPFTV